MTISIKIVLRAAAPLLLVTGAVLSTPAAATEAREAIRLCDAAPGCSFNVNNDGGIVVVTQAGGVVQCPAKGPCSVVTPVRAGKPRPAAGAAGNVTGVLSSGTVKKEPLPKQQLGAAANPKKIETLRTVERRSSATTGSGGSKQH